MIRTQIMVTEEQHAYLKELSRQTGRSLSDLIREAIEDLRSGAPTPVERAKALLGAFEADRDDVSERHDYYFPDEP